MPTSAMFIQDLQEKMIQLQIAQTNLVIANTQSGNLVSTSSVTAIQTAINTVQTAVNALTPTFYGNN